MSCLGGTIYKISVFNHLSYMTREAHTFVDLGEDVLPVALAKSPDNLHVTDGKKESGGIVMISLQTKKQSCV